MQGLLISMPSILVQIALPLVLALFHFVGPIPTDLSADGGQLSSCPGLEHCASSQWQVADSSAALKQLSQQIKDTPRTEIVEQSANYLHATYSSRIFGFVDDLELSVTDAVTLEARSISRLGESDLGVNAQRLEGLGKTIETSEA